MEVKIRTSGGFSWVEFGVSGGGTRLQMLGRQPLKELLLNRWACGIGQLEG